MSLWGMNDGSNLTGDGDFTNGANTVTSDNVATTFDTELEAGDVVIGADSLLYRVTAVANSSQFSIDRDYEGSTAGNETIVYTELPRHLKITDDNGNGLTLAQLGVYGFSTTEAKAGDDNVVSIANENNTYSKNNNTTTTQGGAGYTSAPTVTISAPTAHTFDATDSGVVVAADDAIVLGAHSITTGTALRYLDDGSGVVSGLTNNTVYYAYTANSTAIKLYNSATNAQAGGATGLVAISDVGSGTADTLQGINAAATAVVSGGRVTGYTVTNTGTDYKTAPTVTVATEAHTFAADGVAANGEIEFTAAHGLSVGDRVQYSDGGGTALTELTNEEFYYVQTVANTTAIYIASTQGGDALTLTAGSAENHTLTGEAATATSSLGVGTASFTADMKGAHAGWVKRTIGTGNRAGRIHYETLVAASSITGDGEDIATPDA